MADISDNQLADRFSLVGTIVLKQDDETAFNPGEWSGDEVPQLAAGLRGAVFWDQGASGIEDLLVAARKNADDDLEFASLLVGPPGRTQPYVQVFNVKDYEATGDGTTDDTTAITAAVTAAELVNGIVYFPEGTYLATGILIDAGSVTLQGAGRDATVIKAKAGNVNSTIDIRSTAGRCAVRDLTINGNRANTTTGHGIRISGVGHLLENLLITDSKQYGIGVGQASSTTTQDLRINNVRITNAGNDGIDFKNWLNTNRNNTLTNVSIEEYDLDLAGEKAGIDCRGPVKLVNVEVRGTGSINGGHIRFRPGDDVTNLGGHDSTLTNFLLVGNDTNSTYGIQCNAHDVHIGNGHVENLDVGVTISDVRSTVVNVTAESCVTFGFYPSLASTSLYAEFIGCNAISGAGEGFRINGALCELVGCKSINNGTYGVRLMTGAENCRVIGGEISGNTTANVLDGSTGASMIFVQGLTETVVNESGADVDFRVEGDAEANLLFVDASADRVGIGTATPASKFQVIGNITSTGTLVLDKGAVINETGIASDFRVEGDTDANLITAQASTDRVAIGNNAPSEKLHVTGNILATGSVKSNGTAGVGYATGAGGTVTQATSKATGVTLSKTCGQITLHNAALAADTTVSFTLTNTTIAAGDVVVLNHISGGTVGAYTLNAQSAAGSATINVRNITAGSLGEAVVIAFAVVKAVTS